MLVTVILVLLWCFLGYLSAERIEGKTASPAFLSKVTLTEDVRIVDINQVIDATLSDDKQYDHTDIPTGTVGTAFIPYGRRHHIINDPETDINSFRVSFYLNKEHIEAQMKTGPESKLDEDDIYYRKFENFEEIISEYNQKVRDAKSEWRKQLIQRILTCLIAAAVFSVIFFIECIVANKIMLHLLPGIAGSYLFQNRFLICMHKKGGQLTAFYNLLLNNTLYRFDLHHVEVSVADFTSGA